MKPVLQSVTVHSPGTVANLVCGFDVLGLALSSPNDIMTLRISTDPGLHITHLDGYNLPTAPEQNVAGAALMAMMEHLPKEYGLELEVTKQIKPGSGIGSSAASSAGAVVAANLLFGSPFSNDQLVQFAMFGEKLASGVKHADNIAPAIFGGVTLIRAIHPLDIVRIQPPQLWVTVIHPQIEVRTSDARQILKQQVLLKDAIKQWGNVGGLVAGLLQQDYDLIGRSLEDVIIEPTRSILIPGFKAAKEAAKAAGALGGGISGSGPSVFMLSKTAVEAEAIAVAMSAIYKQMGLAFHAHVSPIAEGGVQLVSSTPFE